MQRSDGVEALDDGLIGAVIEAVRPARPNGHGSAWDGCWVRGPDQVKSREVVYDVVA
ncbi:hypothetical protein QYS60_21280 [Rhodococcus sp. GXMU-t2271]|uniref:hypothetical protein n=1 Tax=Rhodococcus sp. GXMU-t2271 TaxID=3059079 RepID=UPI00352AA3E5